MCRVRPNVLFALASRGSRKRAIRELPLHGLVIYLGGLGLSPGNAGNTLAQLIDIQPAAAMGAHGYGLDVPDTGPEERGEEVVLEKVLDPKQVTAFTESLLHGFLLGVVVKLF